MSVFTVPGALRWHVEMGTEEGMKDERFPHTYHSIEKDTISAVLVWVNTAGVFFEQSGPFDSHLNKIQIEGAEHTIHLPEKKATIVYSHAYMWENGMGEDCRALRTLLSKQQHLGATSVPPPST